VNKAKPALCLQCLGASLSDFPCRPLIVQMVTNPGTLFIRIREAGLVGTGCNYGGFKGGRGFWLPDSPKSFPSIGIYKVRVMKVLFADCLEPRCRLQEEDSEDYGPVIEPASAVAGAIKAVTEAHLKQNELTVSSKPIVMRAE